LLKFAAKRLAEGLRQSDLLFRYGGEEFAVILPETSIEEATLVGERLRSLVSVESREHREVLHMSFGVAGSNGREPLPTIDVLLTRADEALYPYVTSWFLAWRMHRRPEVST
jgi:two-component system cell cycle response regulator